ncbi:MAG: hypothetical protein CMH32_06780 [Micavibrio sp.]|nr:hypothetical protein [Micavibrio sp.]
MRRDDNKNAPKHLLVLFSTLFVCGLLIGASFLVNKQGFASSYFPSTTTMANKVENAHEQNNISYVSQAKTFAIKSAEHSANIIQNVQATTHAFTTASTGALTAQIEKIGAGLNDVFLAIDTQLSKIDIKAALHNIAEQGYAVMKNVDQTLVSMKNTIHEEKDQTNTHLAMNDSADAFELNNIEPTSGGDTQTQPQEPSTQYLSGGRFEKETDQINTEGVLVPKERTVISSSRDGKIAHIYFDNGDRFKTGDTLLEYECHDAQSEAQIAYMEDRLRSTELNTTMRLLNLDLISNIEREKAETEKGKAEARVQLYNDKVSDCYIHATYDGRVVKRLANPNEYTRTDRVLMEVASDDLLDIEFLLPSKWLRWVNINAPFTVTINETGRTYEGKISRIFGEVDPVSQSIQMRGTLENYNDRLLPGMSGNIDIDISAIRDAGVVGYLEKTRAE